jgi:hypothetical protein
MDQRPAAPRISTQQRTRDAAMRRLRRLTMGAAALGTAGTVAMGAAAGLSNPGHATATAQAVAVARSATSAAVDQDASATTAPTAAPATTAAPTDQLGSSTVVVGSGQAGSGVVTSGGS